MRDAERQWKWGFSAGIGSASVEEAELKALKAGLELA